MRFMKGFWAGFQWVHCRGESSKTSALLASCHPRDSITWKWGVYWQRPRKVFSLPGFKKWNVPNRVCGSYTLVLPIGGALTFSWQDYGRERPWYVPAQPPEDPTP